MEWDLHQHCGIDVLDFPRGRLPWGKLVRLAEQLPRWSRYQAARADDDEIAEVYLATGADESRPPPPTLAGYDPLAERLDNLLDALNQMHATLVGAHSKDHKRPDVRPAPRPVTALDRARRRANEREAEAVRAAFTPTREGV